MRKLITFKFCTLILIVSVQSMQNAQANLIELSMKFRRVTAAEASDPTGAAPKNGRVFEYFVTTDDDILAINFVTTSATAPFFQHPFGSNSAAPNPTLASLFPGLGADSYIRTPGATSVLGGGFPNNGDDTYGDASNDGPQTKFKFAVLTVPRGHYPIFSGQINIRGTSGIYSQNFSFILPLIEFPDSRYPEPSSVVLIGLGMSGLSLRRRMS